VASSDLPCWKWFVALEICAERCDGGGELREALAKMVDAADLVLG